MTDRLGFQLLASRLTRYLNELVRRGEVSERGLAHLTGYSQPHIHNVLKAARGMNIEFADQLMAALGVSMLSLFTQDELSGMSPTALPESLPVPVLAGRLGGGKPFPRLTTRPHLRQLPATAVQASTSSVLAVLDTAERSMWPALWPNDLVLIDRDPAGRRNPRFEQVYAISWKGRGWVGRCRRVGRVLVVAVDNLREVKRTLPQIPLSGQNILDIVKGTIVWLGRDLEAVPLIL